MKQNRKLIVILLLVVLSVIGLATGAYAAGVIECPACGERAYAPNGKKFPVTEARQYKCSSCGHVGTMDE